MKTPPKWPAKLLSWYCHPDYSQEIIGDLEEMYFKWRESKGSLLASVLFILNTILFFRLYNSRFTVNYSNNNYFTMLKHSVKLSFKNFQKYKVYNFGNLFGLTIGIAISLMIFQHVSRELSYEKSFPKHERIFRVSTHNEWAKSSPALAEELQNYFPEVKNAVRFAKNGGDIAVIIHQNHKTTSENVYLTDQSVFEVFDLKMKQGFSDSALVRPFTVIVTESIAARLFGDTNPVGKMLEIDERAEKYEITGMIEDLPENSHIKADILISMPTFYKDIPTDWTSSRGWMVMHTYALIDSERNIENFYSKMPDFMTYYAPAEIAKNMQAKGNFFEIFPITDIHLHSAKIQEMGINSDITYIYIFSALAGIILLIVGVNFINMFTTLVFKRVKEVGLRKIVGASKTQIAAQLIVEALVYAFVAAVLAIVLCASLLPYYNAITDLDISYTDLLSQYNILLVFAIAVGMGVASSVYPAYLIANHQLSESISSYTKKGAGISIIRKGLIAFQFALSLFILISTLVINQQMDFITNKDLGYQTDHLLSVRFYGKLRQELFNHRNEIFNTLKTNPEIEEVSQVSNLIGEPLSMEGFVPADAGPDNEYPAVNMIWADENYLSTMKIDLLQGRDFSAKTDTGTVFLVNEQLAKLWNKEVVGTMGEFRDQRGPIVGVFRDINFQSLHSRVAPLVISYKPSWTSNVLFKINGKNPLETMEFIESTFKARSPESVIQFNYMDDQLRRLYKSERSMFLIFKIFSVLTLIISCVGLLGIAAIEVQRRTKEVGIRKVLGASGQEILMLLSKEFGVLILIAIFIGIPISYFIASDWLENYSYATPLNLTTFILPSISLVATVFLIITLHSLKVMRANPTESLRDE